MEFPGDSYGVGNPAGVNIGYKQDAPNGAG